MLWKGLGSVLSNALDGQGHFALDQVAQIRCCGTFLLLWMAQGEDRFHLRAKGRVKAEENLPSSAASCPWQMRGVGAGPAELCAGQNLDSEPCQGSAPPGRVRKAGLGFAGKATSGGCCQGQN